MSQSNHEDRMKVIRAKRGRTPIKAAAEVRHGIFKRKSQAGIEYTVYKPILIKKK